MINEINIMQNFHEIYTFFYRKNIFSKFIFIVFISLIIFISNCYFNTNLNINNNIKYNIKNNINNNIKNSKEEKANNKTINKYGSVEYYYNKILNYVANKIDGTVSDALIYLACLEEINPIAALNIYLKEISYELNSKYVTSSIASSIKNLKDVYIISAYTGHVIALINTNRKALKYLAWFKNKEEAEFARQCVIGLIERIFGKDDQSKN